MKNLHLTYLMGLLGQPYVWGGDDPVGGFDCSGLASEWLQSTGVLPHKSRLTAHGLYGLFSKNNAGNDRKFGALVFYGKPDFVSHVDIVLNENFIIGASGGGAKNQTREDAIRTNGFVKIRPAKYRSDVVAVVLPKYPFAIE